MFHVHFQNVGIWRKSWAAHLPAAILCVMLSSIKQHGAIMSDKVMFAYNPNATHGIVFVDGIPAGAFFVASLN